MIRRSLGIVVIAVLPLVAACGAGRATTTDKERQTPYVASGTAGPLFLTAASLVPSQSASGTGSGTSSASPTPSSTASATPSASESSSTAGPPDSSTGSGSVEAYLVVTIVNRGTQPDQLNGVLVQGASVTPSDNSASSLTVPPGQVLRFVDPDFGTGTSLQVSGFSQPIQPGSSVPVTFQFQQAGAVTIQVPVRESVGTTATSTPVPLTGSYPSASGEPEAKPTGG